MRGTQGIIMTITALKLHNTACNGGLFRQIGGKIKITCSLLVSVFKLLSLNYKSIYGELKMKKNDKNPYEGLSF